MKRIHLPSLLAATVATGAGLLLITEGAPSAHAEGVIHATGRCTLGSDGSISAQGPRGLTTANGTTFDASTTYTQGSGFSCSGSCKDAAGNTVSCAPR